MILVGPHADAMLRKRFATEAEAVARLQHPNIVQIHEVGEHDGRPYVALEYVEGSNLQESAARKAQPERQAAELVEKLARTMHHTHQRGILHRDLKPTNILLTEDGTPKITDFGLAKLLDQGGGLTRAEAVIGTPSYMSPEQAAGDSKKIGVPADVYSLGAILYELLAGRAPFQGTTLLNTLEQVRSQPPASLRRLRRSIARDLETICLKCLEKEPANRYATAAALADDLHRYLGGESIRARRLPVWQRLTRAAWRRRTRVAGTFGLLALACMLLGSFSYFQLNDQVGAHRVEERYQEFVSRRDDALFYGLLAPEEGTFFLGADAVATAHKAETAAKDAFALAGVDLKAGVSQPFLLPPGRKTEVEADCYALILLLADAKAQQTASGQKDYDRDRELLRLNDQVSMFPIQTRTYHARREQLLESLGRREEAGQERAWVDSLPLTSALDHFLLGQEQYRRAAWAEAKDSFNKALSAQPEHFWARFFLAVCHLKTLQWEAARVGLNACINQRPGFVWSYLLRSFANEKLHAPADAEADFKRALALDPNEDARYVLHSARGILYFNRGALELAAQDFQAALALRPKQYNVYLNLAQVALARKQFAEAEESTNRALRIAPPTPVVVNYHVECARKLIKANQHERALQATAAALALAPGHAAALEARSRALFELHRFGEAERAFSRYLEAGGQALPGIFRGRGQCLMKLGKFPEAADDYSRALELSPDAELYQHRGWANYFAEAPKLALRDFSKAIQLDADAPDAYIGRGLTLVALGNHQGAIEDADRALRLQPTAPEMLHNAACIFAQAAAHAFEEGDHKSSTDYRAAAVTTLRMAMERLPPAQRNSFWHDKIMTDSALAPLHGLREFARLGDEFAKKADSP